MAPEWRSVIFVVVKHLEELDRYNVSKGENELDVFSKEIRGKVDEVIKTPVTDVQSLASILERPGASFRSISETQLAVALWLYVRGDAGVRRLLRATLTPKGVVITLITYLAAIRANKRY